MTTEQLLTPRYKVIAEWPDNTFDIGQILTESDMVEDWLQTDNFLHGFKLSEVEKYPHLFQKLEWHEDRNAGELPMYVKTGSGNRVAKAKFDLTETSAYYMFLDDEIHPYSPFGWLPADESEYQQYLITNSKQ